MTKAGSNCLTTLRSRGHGEAAFFADHLIEKHFLHIRIGDANKISQLSGILCSFVEACRKAAAELPYQAQWTPGECWSLWIRNLTGALKEERLPTAARKDSGQAHRKGFRVRPFC